MEQTLDSSCKVSKDTTLWIFTLPAVLGTDSTLTSSILPTFFLAALATFLSSVLLTWALSPGGPAWSNGRTRRGSVPIPGPRGLPVIGSLLSLTHTVPHRTLAALASSHSATQLMAISVGSTPTVVTSDPAVAREILSHALFADRPAAQARVLMFSRAIGFAPSGAYWRLLRRIASTHLFSPRRVAAHELGRQADCSAMLRSIADQQLTGKVVTLRPHLQGAALNNIMGSVFGRRYDVSPGGEEPESMELKEMVGEGFELLGDFNWSDHLPWLAKVYDGARIKERCAALIPRVRRLVMGIIEEHKKGRAGVVDDEGDFVDVLLSLEGDEKLEEEDMVAILWEMIFRGTDTTALLTEWAMAELVLHPVVQARIHTELNVIVKPGRIVADADVARMPYLQAVIKETLRVHPPGPLLSWSRRSTSDVHLSNGMVVPAGTTAMVNMWAIAHDNTMWAQPNEFVPERFLEAEGGTDVDVRGGDLRLAPFGAGRRVCPGKNLGFATVALWVARLVHNFEWAPAKGASVDLTELLKLSCQMKTPLTAMALQREDVVDLL